MPIASIRARLPRIVQSRQNARVKELRSGFAGSARTDQDHVAIEGQHLIIEALSSGLRFAAVFVQSGNEALLDRLTLPEHVELLALPPDIFASAVNTESPQGIAALIEAPAFTLADILTRDTGHAPLLVIAAGLQDPGNLGTLIRSAEAFGATGVCTLPGTVSVWNQKTLRASAGSIFRLPTITASADEVFAALASHQVATVAAVAAQGQPLTRHDLTRPTAIILGNEGNGIPPEILNRAGFRVTIPTPGPVESLNAAIAGSILLYEAARQRASLRA